MPSFLRGLLDPAGLRPVLRGLRRQPLLTLTTLLALAVGIGMATTGWTLLEAVVWGELPYPNGDRFVLLDARTEPESDWVPIELARFRFLEEHATAFEHLGAFRGREANLELAPGEVTPVTMASITAGSHAVLPHAPLAGRLLVDADGRPGAPPVAVVRASLWRNRFGGDPAFVGRSIVVSGVARTVVGIAPDELRFPGSEEIWIPLAESAAGIDEVRVFGVVREGMETEAASAEVGELSRRYEAADGSARRVRLEAMPFVEALSRGLGILTGVLLAALLALLGVIAANLAQLAHARTAARAGELAVRTALGASRGRLVGEISLEILLLGAGGAAIGVTASQILLARLRAAVQDVPFWVDYSAGPRTLLFVALVTVAAALVAGVRPALRATRRDPARALAEVDRRTATAAARGGGWAIAVQVAVSLALINAALVLARGVAGYGDPALLVPPESVLTARVVRGDVAIEAVLRAVEAIPGVEAAGAATALPGSSPPTEMTVVEAAPGGSSGEPRPAPVVAAEPGFFAAFGAEPIAGRLFLRADHAADAAPVVIVNQPFVDKFLGGRNALGARIRIVAAATGEDAASAAAEPWREIVGVVPDLALSAGDPELAAGFYVPLGDAEVVSLALRAGGDARRLEGALRAALARLDPEIQLHGVRPILEVAREDRAVFAGIGAALGVAGGMALLLSAIGTYALLSLAVTRRTREIGIRAALGASRGGILRAVVGRAVVAPALGALAGIAFGDLLVAARGIFAFRLPESAGPWALPLLALLMVLAGLASAWQPARRALAVDPSEALRAD